MAKINISNCKVIDKYEGSNSIEAIYINFISIKLSDSYEEIENELEMKGDKAYEN
ncbi:hypothetical protein [Clostridium cibarium]|uniref:Uncharacterized protein n=1 Tax=Clostridium cibarium TaxID=2762247 RepID=A0ABR8PXP2_9CLOT|nr:hypothetical protein [Clostridium cibarium]MBD7912934.1 hypothetical protein [Clostridium cibarium]